LVFGHPVLSGSIKVLSIHVGEGAEVRLSSKLHHEAASLEVHQHNEYNFGSK
jgi:hypothetical protein